MDAAYFENALLDIDLPGADDSAAAEADLKPVNIEAQLGDGDPTVLSWARAM
ncbi:MAG: hypothetical protein ACXW3D_05100 [Caulobacteraceae bacterium]